MLNYCNFTVSKIHHVIERESTKDWRFNAGATEHAYLVLNISGVGIYDINGEIYKLYDNDVIFIPPHTERKGSTDEEKPWHFVSIAFYYEDNDGLFKNMEGKPVVIRNAPRQVRENFKNIVTEWNIRSMVYKPLCRACIQAIMCNVVMFRESKNFNPVHYANIEKVKIYIQENFHKNLSVEELAQIAELSPSHFRKLFREIVGISATQYAINMRINKAKDLLASGSANVSEAAFASGFKDIYYFSSMFKKVTGENPSKYNK